MSIPLPVDGLSGTAPLDVINLRILRALVAIPEEKGGDRTVVDIEWFGHILNWFGPFARKSFGLSVLDRMRLLCENPWFHGDLEMADAQLKLSGAPPGTFLVRFSTNPDFPGAYTITKVNKDNSISNVRIIQEIGVGFKVNDDRMFNNLEELIQCLQEVLFLQYACGASRFQQYVAGLQPELAGYAIVK